MATQPVVSNKSRTTFEKVGLILVAILCLPTYISLALALAGEVARMANARSPNIGTWQWWSLLVGLTSMASNPLALVTAIVLSIRRTSRKTKVWCWVIIGGAIVAAQIAGYLVFGRYRNIWGGLFTGTPVVLCESASTRQLLSAALPQRLLPLPAGNQSRYARRAGSV